MRDWVTSSFIFRASPQPLWVFAPLPFTTPNSRQGSRPLVLNSPLTCLGKEAVVRMRGAARSPDVLAAGRDACWCSAQCRDEDPDPKSQCRAASCPEPLPPEAPALLVAQALPGLWAGTSPREVEEAHPIDFKGLQRS